jgi:hypothetical protein
MGRVDGTVCTPLAGEDMTRAVRAVDIERARDRYDQALALEVAAAH